MINQPTFITIHRDEFPFCHEIVEQTPVGWVTLDPEELEKYTKFDDEFKIKMVDLSAAPVEEGQFYLFPATAVTQYSLKKLKGRVKVEVSDFYQHNPMQHLKGLLVVQVEQLDPALQPPHRVHKNPVLESMEQKWDEAGRF